MPFLNRDFFSLDRFYKMRYNRNNWSDFMDFIRNQSKREKFRRVFALFLGVWTAFVGALFILQVWRIFLEGDGFTVESVSVKFLEILAPFLIWVVAIVFGGVFALAFPTFEKSAAYIHSKNTLKKLTARLPQKDGGRYAFNARFVAWCVGFIVALVCAIVSLVYLTSSAYEPVSSGGFFLEHQEAERLVRALPWVFAGFGAAIAVSFFEEYSLRKEISLVKTKLAENAKNGVVVKARNSQKTVKNNNRATFFVRVAVGSLAIILIVWGIANGGMADVLGKAINICTQCIGLG